MYGRGATGDTAPALVALEVTVDGIPSAIALKSAVGAVATVHVPGGLTWGIVPRVETDGNVEVALHDMSSTPNRLIGTRTLQPGLLATFDDVEPSLSVRLAPQ